MKTKWILLALCLIIIACVITAIVIINLIPTSSTTTGSLQPALPNPASVYCEQNGGKSEIRTAADGSQAGYCIFTDNSECDEWAFYRGECKPADPSPSAGPTEIIVPSAASPTSIPTAFPIDPGLYQGFWTYTNPEHGFSIMLPQDWIVDQATSPDPLMSDHILVLRPEQNTEVFPLIRMSFRSLGEDALLWPTGVGQGEFIPGGTLDVAGQPVQRIYLACPGGQITAIWYQGGEGQPNIQRGDMEFSFIYTTNGAYCEGDYVLTGKIQQAVELIIASLQVP